MGSFCVPNEILLRILTHLVRDLVRREALRSPNDAFLAAFIRSHDDKCMSRLLGDPDSMTRILRKLLQPFNSLSIQWRMCAMDVERRALELSREINAMNQLSLSKGYSRVFFTQEPEETDSINPEFLRSTCTLYDYRIFVLTRANFLLPFHRAFWERAAHWKVR